MSRTYFLPVLAVLLSIALLPWLASTDAQAQQAGGGENFIFINYIGREMTLDVDDVTYFIPGTDTMPAGGRLALQLPAGSHKFAAQIPAELHFKDGKGKYILRRVAQKFLPNQIFHKKKQGFAIPADEWFRHELWDMASDLLTGQRFQSRGYFNRKNISKILQEHKKGSRDYSTWLWCLLNFELWYQTYLDSDLRKI